MRLDFQDRLDCQLKKQMSTYSADILIPSIGVRQGAEIFHDF